MNLNQSKHHLMLQESLKSILSLVMQSSLVVSISFFVFLASKGNPSDLTLIITGSICTIAVVFLELNRSLSKSTISEQQQCLSKTIPSAVEKIDSRATQAEYSETFMRQLDLSHNFGLYKEEPEERKVLVRQELSNLWLKSTKKLETQNVIGFPVTAEAFETQVDTMLGWARQRLSKAVCVADVHMLIEAKLNEGFARVLYRADMLTPNGMPLVWVMKRLRKRQQDRVAGMDIMLSLCEKAAKENVGIFFLGSTAEVLWNMQQRLNKEYPNLTIAGMESPPFRPLTTEEDKALVERINASGAGLVLVALGCPKQEWWMYNHKGRVKAVMVGLGGVFPVFAGEKKWAPVWVQKNGLEWLYRLVQEPRRLWERYAKTVPLFILLAFKQLVKVKLGLEPRFGDTQRNVTS